MINKKGKTIVIGIIVLSFMLGGSVLATDIKQSIEVYFNKIHIQINGEPIEAANITYNDTTYVPLRKVAEIFNKKVGWTEGTSTASIDDFDHTPAIKITYEELINELSAGKQRDVLTKLDKMKEDDRSKLFLSVISNWHSFNDKPIQPLLTDALKSMLNSPMDINIQDSHGFTPLIIAAQRSIKLVPLLLEHDANVNIRNNEGDTPLMYIASRQDLNLFNQLIDRGADPLAIDNGGSDVLMSALQPFMDLEFNQDSHKIHQMLVELNADVNHRTNDNYTNTLQLAVIGGRHDFIKILLQKGADPNQKDANGYIPLLYVTELDEWYKDEQTVIATIKLMLEAGVDINTANEDGDTTLHRIVQDNKSSDVITEDLIKFMLSEGANKNAANKAGKTPLDLAKESNKAELIKLLS
jgi:ankyrin repeat protein